MQTIFAHNCSNVLLGLDISKTTETQLVKEKEVETSKPGTLWYETHDSCLHLSFSSTGPSGLRRGCIPGATLTSVVSVLKVHIRGESGSLSSIRVAAVLPLHAVG